MMRRDPSCIAANQRHLAGELDRLRARLEAHAAANADRPAPAAPAADQGDWALLQVCRAFGLSDFERDILLLAAGVELDARLGSLCAAIEGDPRRRWPSFGLALAALEGAHWSALTPTAPLRRWRLVEVPGEDGLATAALRIDERVLHHLAGVSYIDPRLDGIVTAVSADTPLPASQAAAAADTAARWAAAAGQGQWPVLQICGGDHAGRPAVAAAACRVLGLGVLRFAAENLPVGAADRVAMARLCERELALTGSALLLQAEAGQERLLRGFAEEMSGPLVVALEEPLALEQRSRLLVELERASRAEQRALWETSLGPAAASLNGEIDRLVDRFALDAAGIAQACVQAAGDPGEDVGRRLWSTCRLAARRRLDDLAQRIPGAATWEDLVLPAAQRAILAEIALQVRHTTKVYETWGFAGRSPRGLGISALFTGPSGTGKTMTAEVIANDLDLDLYRIDLSQVVSKYIGETEKNLRRIFAAAEESGAILLFDEADALFGKRSEVKDSHDRYANIEVSYLLQRMEAYRGLAILTTNLKSAIDQAFLRRIRFVVQFPFPDAPHRHEIWQRIFPPHLPTRDLDLQRLAQLAIPGGNIRNVAMNAAFLAADAGEPVTMQHIRRAAQTEYAKIEKPLTASELGGWS